ncbi:MAG: hypothetical protein ASARMPREDX12_005549, partial [Alectoria sarmentosa]
CLAPSEVLYRLGEIRRKATSTVQILLSSLTFVDVTFYFPDCEKLHIDEGKNPGDVDVYVQEEVNSGGSLKRRLLDGKRPNLETRLAQSLIARAQEMFMWVKIQLDVFFPSNPQRRMRFSNEVDSKVNALESDFTLPEPHSLYKKIMDRNTKFGTLARECAIKREYRLWWVDCIAFRREEK